MIALAMTIRKAPDTQIMCFLRDYAERYNWLVQVFQDWSFTFLSSFLFYEDYDEMEEETRDIYRAGIDEIIRSLFGIIILHIISLQLFVISIILPLLT